MSERERLKELIANLERQRGKLDDAVIDSALAPLRAELSQLEAGDLPVESRPPAERRVVTVLFCDVVGSTALAEGMDPEEWTGIMNDAFERLNEPVDRYGGWVARLMGDAILAFFGAPITRENDPERAVMAGLEILTAIKPYRQKLKEEKGLDFNVRVGINTGLAVVGDVGSEVHGEYTAMGDAVNVAARMEQTAAPGTVQIAADTFHHIAPLFDCEKLGDITVKGKSLPVRAYRVVRRKIRPGSVRGLGEKGLVSPMVGRQVELAAVNKAIQGLVGNGEGGLVLIFGEAGLGKSRLKEEVRQATGDGPLWLEGDTVSYGQSLGYWPFQKIIQQFAGISGEDDEAAAWAKLEKGIVALHGEETADVLPYLASMLALEVREPYAARVKDLDGDALGKQVYFAIWRFFEHLARTRPLVLVFEDVHWIDAASARLLENVLPLAETSPLLIIGLSRPGSGSAGEHLGQAAREELAGSYMEVRLEPLPASAGESLVAHLLTNAELPVQLRQDILERAGGNPYFLEEMVRTLIDVGALERESLASPAGEENRWRWKAAAGIESVILPETIQGVVLARVDRLAEEVKQVLRTASVIGRSFYYRVLQMVTEGEPELEGKLSTLEAVDLIQETEQLAELKYMFKHALTQEAVYESILLHGRRKTHKRVAQSIETIFEDRLEEFFGLLAYHYAQAEAWQVALDYLLKAGDLAEKVAADDEALAHYRRAMWAYERAFGDSWDPLQRAKLERKMSQALLRRGDHEQAFERVQRALSLLGRPLPASRPGLLLEISGEAAEQLVRRLAPGLLRESSAPDASPRLMESVLDYQSIVPLHLVAGPGKIILATLKALNISERIGHEAGMVEGYLALSSMFVLFGRFRMAEYYGRLGGELADRLGRADHVATLKWHQALVYEKKGQLEQVVDRGQEAAQYYREAGLLRREGSVNVLVLEAMLALGRYEEVNGISQELLEKGRGMGDKQVEAWAYSWLGRVQRDRGAPEAAIDLFRQYEELARATRDRPGRVTALANIGHSYLQMAHLTPALEVLREARALAVQLPGPGIRLHSLIDLGLAWASVLAAGADGSRAELDKIDQACKRARKSTRRHLPSQAQALRLQGTSEWLRGRPDKARQWWDRSFALATEIGQPYEQAMTYWEMGERLGDRAHLESAADLLREIGVRPDLLGKLS